jgi:hypothetical protein
LPHRLPALHLLSAYVTSVAFHLDARAKRRRDRAERDKATEVLHDESQSIGGKRAQASSLSSAQLGGWSLKTSHAGVWLFSSSG